MDERERRIGLNEALFRDVNERLESLNETFGEITDRVQVVCECGDLGCHEMLTMSPAEYAAIRSDPAVFFVRRGHETADVEEVIEERDEYDLVRKVPGPPTRLAEATDPRN